MIWIWPRSHQLSLCSWTYWNFGFRSKWGITPNGIFGPWAWWFRGLARWESCWDAVAAAAVSTPNDPKMVPQLRQVLFTGIGHVTKFQEQTPNIIQDPWSITPGAARPLPVFTPYQTFKKKISNISRILEIWKTEISNISRIIEHVGDLNFQYFQDRKK